MARQERKKEDLFIKEKRRAKNFFITSSAKMDDDKGVTKTTISSSVFTKMSESFAQGDPNFEYGDVLPIKREKETGDISPSAPNTTLNAFHKI